MINRQLLNYLVGFLSGIEAEPQPDQRHLSHEYRLGTKEYIGYTRCPEEMRCYRIVIYPSDFFDISIYGTQAAEPKLPLSSWRGVPLLFGKAREEWTNGGQTLVIYADIIASAYYLLSRYEEMYRRSERDRHGRFLAKYSLPYRAGFLDRPIVDEYAEQLRLLITQHNLLDVGVQLEPRPHTFRKINLTHDIDQPYLYRGVKSFCRAVLRERRPLPEALRLCFGATSADRYNTFSTLLKANKRLRSATPKGLTDIIFFWKVPADHPLDKPNYSLRAPYMRSVLLMARRAGARSGLHCSYQAGLDPEYLSSQRQRLQRVLGEPIYCSRHHFLAQREPEDLHILYGAGIRHDYTMGYADVAGFRLGTCRPVKFINPNTRSLTELMLHPLTMMDVTLSRPDFMALDYKAALAYAKRLIERTAYHHGELNLLWHNEQFAPEVHPWLGRLYNELLDYIVQLHRKVK